VDVYDNGFHLVNLRKQHFDEDSADHDNGHSAENPFVDESLPHKLCAFNVQAIGNNIVVTYVLHEEGSRFETDGPDLASWTFSVPPVSSCSVSSTVIG